jgi:hypothetical protein
MLNQEMIHSVLDWSYGKAVNGLPGTSSAQELADNFLGGPGTLSDQGYSLVRWQCTKSGTSGFLSGLGGVVLLPLTLPANVTSVLFINIRMIAALAIMGGSDVRDDRVKTLVFACLCGNAAKDILKGFGIRIGKKMAETALKNISGDLIIKINQQVGFRLLTKFGERGAVNLVKAIPLVGGLVGGGVDALSTHAVGSVAHSTFIT